MQTAKLCRLSHTQDEIWRRERLDEGRGAWCTTWAVRLGMTVRLDLVEEAVWRVVAATDALRLRVDEEGGRVFQWVAAMERSPLERVDLCGPGGAVAADAWLHERARAPLAISAGSLVQVVLVRWDDGAGGFLLKAHPVAVDGPSAARVVARIVEGADRLAAGEAGWQPPSAPSAIDAVAREEHHQTTERAVADAEHWSRLLEGAPRPTALRADRISTDSAVLRVQRRLPAALAAEIHAVARARRTEIVGVLLAAVGACLYRTGGAEDVLLGSTLDGVVTPELGDVVGALATTVPVRLRCGASATFGELLDAVRGQLELAREHWPCHTDEAHAPGDGKTGGPRLDIVVTRDVGPALPGGVEVLSLRPDDGPRDLTVRVGYADSPAAPVEVTVEVRRDLMSAADAEALLDRLLRVVRGGLAEPKRALSRLDLLSPAERERLLVAWNATAVDLPEGETLVGLFEDRAARTPRRPAVALGDRALSFGELNARANRVARRLRRLGVVPQQRVGIAAQHCVEAVVGLLGIAKSGGAWVRVDPTHPAVRNAFILADSGAGVLLTLGDLPQDLSFAGTVLDLADDQGDEEAGNLDPVATPESLAYVAYTSGADGRPLGVAVEHGSLLNLCCWARGFAGISDADTVAALDAPVGEAHLLELWPTLLSGACVRVLPDEARVSPREIHAHLGAHGVTVAFLLLHVAEPFLELPAPAGLRWLGAVGGAPRCPVPRGITVAALFGQAECTGVATAAVLDPGAAGVAVGRGIANTHLVVLDRHGNLMPVGVPGELGVSGRGVARGYLNRLEASAARFVAHPVLEGRRMLSTGDLAMWREDGQIELVGRCDRRLVLGGERIEPAEVERRLLGCPGVREAVVVAVPDDARALFLVAAYVADEDVDPAALRRELPDSMVPWRFQRLAAMPLASDGSVDRCVVVAAVAGIASLAAAASGATPGAGLPELGAPALSDGGVEQLAPDLDVAGDFPLGAAQAREYFRACARGAQGSGGVPLRLDISGPLDEARLLGCVEQLVRRHEALRTSFVVVGGEPRQRIWAATRGSMVCRRVFEAELPDAIAGFARPLGPETMGGLRAELLTLSVDSHVLLLDVHPAVADAASLDIVVDELLALYDGRELPPPSRPYRELAIEQAAAVGSDRARRQEESWRSRFLAGVPVLDLPTDFPHEGPPDLTGDRVAIGLDRALTRRLHELAATSGATLQTVLLAGFGALLARISGADDIVVGVGSEAARTPRFERAVGVFATTVPVQSAPSPGKEFRAYLAEVRRELEGSVQVPDLPFDLAVESLQVARDGGYRRVFDVAVEVHESSRPATVVACDATFVRREPSAVPAHLDLELHCSESSGALLLSLVYRRSRFAQSSMERLVFHLANLLTGAAWRPEARLSDLALLSGEEERRLARAAREAEAVPPREATVHGRFSVIAARLPEATAVTSAGHHMSYRELAVRSSALARALRARGVGPEVVVGLLLDVGPDLVTATLAVLDAGGCCMPLDPGLPAASLAAALKESGARLLLTEAENRVAADLAVDLVDVGDEANFGAGEPGFEPTGSPHDTAFVLRGDGGAGAPGVMLTHRSLVRTLLGDTFAFAEGNAWAMAHAPWRDLALWQVLGALLSGGRLVIVPASVAADPRALVALCADEQVNVLTLTGLEFSRFASAEVGREGRDLAIRHVLLCGGLPEPGLLPLWRSRHPEARLHAMYGSAETTIHSTRREIGDEEISSCRSMLGRPLPGVAVYVMDASARLVPPGVPGEVFIAGEGVARGYLRRPDLDTGKFVGNPYRAGERLCRTGDRARLLPSGEIELLGRQGARRREPLAEPIGRRRDGAGPGIAELPAILESRRAGADSGELAARWADYRRRNLDFFSLDLKEQAALGSVLLTGATGHVGVHILEALLVGTQAQIWVVVRASSHRDAEARFARAVAGYLGVEVLTAHAGRLHALAGEASADHLGLAPQWWQALAESVDCIVHAAPLAEGRPGDDNLHSRVVGGTENALALAQCGRQKSFHFVSRVSLAAGHGAGREELVLDEDDGDLGPGRHDPVAMAMAEAEVLVRSARERGLDARIYRLGNARASTRCAAARRAGDVDPLYLAVKAIANLGVVGWSEDEVEATPVDLLARAIVLLMAPRALGGQTFHLVNPHPVRLAQALTDPTLGLAVRAVPLPELLAYLAKNADARGFKPHVESLMMHLGWRDILDGVAAGCPPVRLSVLSERTDALLARLGFEWPRLEDAELAAMVRRALEARVEVLRSSPVFSHLDEAEIEAIARRVEMRSVPSGAVAVVEGEPVECLHLVADGRLELCRRSATGWLGALGDVGPGEVVGEECVLGNGAQILASASAEALPDDVVLFSLSVAEARRLLDASPEMARGLLATVTARLRRTERLVVDR